MSLSNGASLFFFLPEVLLTVLVVFVLLLDLSPRVRGRGIVPYAAALGLLLALGATALQFRMDPAPVGLFHGMLARDGFGTFLKIVILLSSLGVVFLAAPYAARRGFGDGEFCALLLAATLGMCLLASATDLLMVYLALELVSVMSFILAGFLRANLRSSEASLKYVLYGAFASGTMIYGMSLLYGITGATSFDGIRSGLAAAAGDLSPAMLLVIVLMIFAGYGYKIAAVPFHQWCPDVYEGAPTPVTAFLSVGPKAAGLAAAVRFFASAFPVVPADLSAPGGRLVYLLGRLDLSAVLAILCVVTMTWGNLAALRQNNLKRMMAYSSIAHAGYMMTALVILNGPARGALCFYLAVYLFMNLGAFYGVVALEERYGIVEVDQCRGLGWQVPLVGVTMTIFLFSLTGLPPTAGFIGKMLLFGAAVEAKLIWLAVAGVLNSVVSLFYYARIVKALYLDKPAEHAAEVEPVSGYDAFFLTLLAVPVVLLGLQWDNLAGFAARSAELLGMR